MTIEDTTGRWTVRSGNRLARETGEIKRSRPLSVIHALPSMDCGGMEHVVLDLVKLGIELGQQADVLCLEQPGSLADLAASAGANVYCVDKPPGLRLSYRRKVTNVLRRLKPDVLHSHQIGMLFYSGYAAQKCNVPVVVHTEHCEEYCSRRRARWLGYVAGRYAHQFICVSDATARHVLSFDIVPAEKVNVIHNGIDVDFFESARPRRDIVRAELGIPLNASVVGTVGRLAQIKRHDLLIRSFVQVKKKIPSAHLVLVGDGPMRGELAQLVENLSLSDVVHFLGYRDDPERLLAVMDVFVISSDSEGMPLSVLEAWASKLPVIATAVGGLPELIHHNQTGVLVPANDSQALSHAIAGLLADAPSRFALGRSGNRTVRSYYDRHVMVAEYAKLYDRLLNAQ